MKRDITKKMLLLLTGITLAQLAEAETDLGFRLTSPTLTQGKPMLDEQVLDSFGCAGRNRSPELRWMGAPGGTKSFAVTAYDPDAPTGSGWWHWVVIDIPASVSELVPDAGDPGNNLLPAGCRQGRTDSVLRDMVDLVRRREIRPIIICSRYMLWISINWM
jgi:phosphatidylethanolamine-binding protein (PEBP) family uncharacterized protein